MAVTPTVQHFQQTIWSKSILRSLEKITSLRNHCNFQYEKESKNAKEVKILSVNRPTIRTYVPGTALVRESAADSMLFSCSLVSGNIISFFLFCRAKIRISRR